MAKCPDCGHRYGFLGLDRRPTFESCPECGWSPMLEEPSQDQKNRRAKKFLGPYGKASEDDGFGDDPHSGC
jgi:ssDNA-binding Zn-finger/Zn-ribbon topoisomerase 1